MKINGIDLGEFGVSLLSLELQPPQEGPEAVWLPGGMAPNVWPGEQTMGSATVQFYLRGRDPEEIVGQIGRLLEMAQEELLLQELPGYMGEYVGYLSGSDIQKVGKSRQRRILELKLRGYLRGEKERCSFYGVKTGWIRRKGNRPTPAVVTVQTKAYLEQLKIEGLSDEPIVIGGLPADSQVVIDGRDGTVVLDGGESMADTTQMWEVPRLRRQVQEVRFSSDQINVWVDYWPIIL